tara:strand:- start:76071 stop:76481 length:411 start_codon:yes stop_codon:yes gene_type:complete
MNEDNIMIIEGHFGKEDYDRNDIGLNVELICVNNPVGYYFTEDVIYHVSGMGGLEFDETTKKYRTGFGMMGFNLVRNVYTSSVEFGGTSTMESFYILYEDLIRNFIYVADSYDDPTLLPRLKREKIIENILDEQTK